MTLAHPLRWALGLLLASSLPALAVVVNTGTSTAGLTQIANANGTGGATLAISTVMDGSEPVIQATQSGTTGDFALRGAWFASSPGLTGAVYTVSADFKPAANAASRRGGVIGWLNTATNKGIALYIIPAGGQKSLQMATIDFNAAEGSGNESRSNLFTLAGTPATGAFGSAAADVTAYAGTSNATFQIEFTAPTPADTLALSNVTAHIKGKLMQGGVQVGQTIELLTNLPVPANSNHRYGYYAVFADIFSSGAAIGYLDNLTITGSIGEVTPQDPPRLTVVRNGANIEISWPLQYNGFTLQTSTTLTTGSWSNVPTTGNKLVIPAPTGRAFYRLVQ